MQLNLDKLWDKVSPYQGLTQSEYVKLNQKLGDSHVHNIITMGLMGSSTFKSYLNSHTQYFQYPQFWDYGWGKISHKLLKLENHVASLEEIKEKDLYPFVDLLIEYFSIKTIRLPEVCNFHPWKYKAQDNLKDLENLVQNVSKLYPLLGTKSITMEQVSKVYRGIYTHGWGCIEIGEFDIAVYLSEFLHQLSILSITRPELNIKIPQCPTNHPYNHKPKFSSGLILGKAYKGMGNTNKAIQVYKGLIDSPPSFKSSYSFLTRRLEVAIEIFRLQPSDEHRELVNYHLTDSLDPDSQPYFYTQERTREKCLVILYLLNSLYDYKLI